MAKGTEELVNQPPHVTWGISSSELVAFYVELKKVASDPL